jgi:hypothetical protein
MTTSDNNDGNRQDADADPIVENPALPHMDVDANVRPDLIGGEIRLMDDGSPTPTRGGGRGLMDDVPADTTPPTRLGPAGYPPQRPAGRSGAAARSDAAGGYLRLLIRVENGDMSVVGASRVPGPLSRPGPVQGGLAYEVSLGAEQIGAGDVPDPGYRRGVASPGRPDRGHAFVEAPGYEFTARIPVDQIRAESLPDVQIAVYRLDSEQPTAFHPGSPLRAQDGRIAQELTALRGIRTEELPQDVRVSLERALS